MLQAHVGDDPYAVRPGSSARPRSVEGTADVHYQDDREQVWDSCHHASLPHHLRSQSAVRPVIACIIQTIWEQIKRRESFVMPVVRVQCCSYPSRTPQSLSLPPHLEHSPRQHAQTFEHVSILAGQAVQGLNHWRFFMCLHTRPQQSGIVLWAF